MSLKFTGNTILKVRYGINLSKRLNSLVQPVKMAFELYGKDDSKSTPLIIMHGLFGSKQNWRGVAKALGSKLSNKVCSL